FKEAFCDADPGATAHMQMEKLVQGMKTADEYILLFHELAAWTKYNEIAHVEHFKCGLH
ncbi:hypothetical protein DACRYDRAFT_54202, partial [Dacryopinax primogenitus]